ncbi:MAG: rRNA methyltransferase [Coxiella sp. DG_40]|nr:MAG: rRNA methyltransferase [Coxiella sp. DG_40]
MISSRTQQNIKPRKRFGQNFLQDKNIILKIIEAIAPKKTDHIVEIGPGLGALTVQLLPVLKTMDVIELDRDLIPKLQTACRNLGKLNIHQADVLQFDFKKLVKNKHLVRVIGNLPYNISTPLIFHLLKQISYIRDMHFMLQKEVAQRLAAKPNRKDYGRLSVMVQYFCGVTELFTVSPHAFYPVPKVDSALVRLVPHKKILLPAKDVSVLEKIVKLAFNQRRKMISNCLKDIVSNEQFRILNIDPKLRPEQLSVGDFVKISNII